MACPFILAAIRNEAETYLSQGLHQEALAVYNRFLANAGEIDPGLRATIEAAKNRIDSIAKCHTQDEDTRITDVEITFIKKGWTRNASADELAVSAQALIELKRHGHALEEYRRLLMTGQRTATAIKGLTECLVWLVGPDQFADAVSIFANGALKKSNNRMRLKLLIAKNIDAHRYPDHISSLYRHLTRLHPVSEEIRAKIQELGRIVQQTGSSTISDDAYGPMANLNGLCDHLNSDPDKSGPKG